MQAILDHWRAKAPIVPALALAVLMVGLAWVIRYKFVEPEYLGNACEAANQALWWCPPRTAFVIFTRGHGFGLTALVLAAATLVVPARLAFRFAVATMVFGGLGLLLYDTALSATAVLFAGLRSVRLGEDRG